MAMEKSLKRRWLKALRSGEYEQGTDVLCSLDGKRFCCLGVFADVQGARWEERVPEDVIDGHTILIPIPKGKSKPQKGQGDTILASKLRDGLGKEQQNVLADMNDHGFSFEEIADWIEENVKTK